jgi:hypothetical protein
MKKFVLVDVCLTSVLIAELLAISEGTISNICSIKNNFQQLIKSKECPTPNEAKQQKLR